MADDLFKKFKEAVDRIYEEKVAPFHRDTIIGSDDITDLKIQLYLYGDDIDSFIKFTKPVIKN